MMICSPQSRGPNEGSSGLHSLTENTPTLLNWADFTEFPVMYWVSVSEEHYDLFIAGYSLATLWLILLAHYHSDIYEATFCCLSVMKPNRVSVPKYPFYTVVISLYTEGTNSQACKLKVLSTKTPSMLPKQASSVFSTPVFSAPVGPASAIRIGC